MARDEHSEQVPLFCARCAKVLRPGAGDFYHVKIVAVADPAPPSLDEPFAQDIGREIRRLIAQVQDVSEREGLEQVYHREIFALCAPCYARWVADPVKG